MKVELYHTPSELKKLFRKEQNPRLAARIRAVYLAYFNNPPCNAIVLPESVCATWLRRDRYFWYTRHVDFWSGGILVDLKGLLS